MSFHEPSGVEGNWKLASFLRIFEMAISNIGKSRIYPAFAYMQKNSYYQSVLLANFLERKFS